MSYSKISSFALWIDTEHETVDDKDTFTKNPVCYSAFISYHVHIHIYELGIKQCGGIIWIDRLKIHDDSYISLIIIDLVFFCVSIIQYKLNR